MNGRRTEGKRDAADGEFTTQASRRSLNDTSSSTPQTIDAVEVVSSLAAASRGPEGACSSGTISDLQEFRANLHELAPRAEGDVMTLAEQWFQEGEAKGRVEGEASLLTRLLTLKFGELPEAYQARLASATKADLDAWAERVLFATSLEQVFGST